MVQHEYIALTVFAFVYVLIIIGRTRLFHIPIWVSMLIGSVLMISFQVISIESAFKSVNLDIILFLFGMFSIVSALDRSGVLALVSEKILSKAKSPEMLLMLFVFGMGLLSAFLVNDTIAILGVPIAIYISKELGIKPVVFLMALAFSISIGSTMTPIGNPQNLLIAIQSGISIPFVTFIKFLGIPTVVNLVLTYFILKLYFRRELQEISPSASSSYSSRGRERAKRKRIETTTTCNQNTPNHAPVPLIFNKEIKRIHLAKVSIIILICTFAGFIILEILHSYHYLKNFNLSIVAAIGAAAIYALSNERKQILLSVDYSVIVFFAAMFIVTSALWSSGAISMVLSYVPTPNSRDNIIQSNAVISFISITISQVLSNVPFVALYNFVMIDNGFTSASISQWMMLAAASTIAGNLTILGAASNIIIIDIAESKRTKIFTFFEFFKIGIIVTLVNIAIYYVFISMIMAMLT
jgi:Na+/H+ antiporter NhaD/arsenite permease-like protein